MQTRFGRGHVGNSNNCGMSGACERRLTLASHRDLRAKNVNFLIYPDRRSLSGDALN